jgi:hypothetical protein
MEKFTYQGRQANEYKLTEETEMENCQAVMAYIRTGQSTEGHRI